MLGKFEGKFGPGRLVAAGLPCLLGGLIGAWHVILEFQSGTQNTEEMIVVIIFSSVFFGAGLGAIALGLYASKRNAP